MEAELYPIYLAQVTNGCDSLVCKCKYCASNPDHEKFDPSLPMFASRLTDDHEIEPKLCPKLSPLLPNPSIITILYKFNHFVNDFIKRGKIPESCKEALESAFSDVDVFCHTFLLGDHILTNQNLFLNYELIQDFIIAIKEHKKLIKPYFPKIRALIKSIYEREPFSILRIRGLILMFLFADIMDREMIPVIKAITQLKAQELQIFINTLINSPFLHNHMLSTLKSIIDSHLVHTKSEHPHSVNMHAFATFNYILYSINLQYEDPLDPSIFASPQFCSVLLPQCEFDLFKNGNFSYLKTPSILTPEFKAKMILIEGAFFSSLNNNRKLTLLISRQNVISDAKKQLISRQKIELRRRFGVEFTGEAGQDQGGVSREFFSLVVSQLLDESAGLFKPVGNAYWFAPEGNTKDKGLYTLIGIIIGLAITSAVILPVRFPRLLYKKLIGADVKLSDFSELAPEVAESFKLIRKMIVDGVNVSDLCLTFVCSDDNVELVPGGADKEVTNDNAEEYIQKYIDYVCNRSVSPMFKAMEEGYQKACDTPVMHCLDADDVDTLVSGEESFDWDAMKKNVVYEVGYDAKSETVVSLWRVFDALKEAEKRAFLRFVTGSDRAPWGGLSNLTLRVSRSADTALLPTAHTCKYILVLPDYRDMKKMTVAMRVMCENNQGLDLI